MDIRLTIIGIKKTIRILHIDTLRFCAFIWHSLPFFLIFEVLKYIYTRKLLIDNVGTMYLRKQDFLDKNLQIFSILCFYDFIKQRESVLRATLAERNKATFHSNPTEYIRHKIQT